MACLRAMSRLLDLLVLKPEKLYSFCTAPSRQTAGKKTGTATAVPVKPCPGGATRHGTGIYSTTYDEQALQQLLGQELCSPGAE